MQELQSTINHEPILWRVRRNNSKVLDLRCDVAQGCSVIYWHKEVSRGYRCGWAGKHFACIPIGCIGV